MQKSDKDMRKSKARISPREREFARRAGAYWDIHSLSDVWAKTKPITMSASLETSTLMIYLDPRFAARLETIARRQSLSIENWLKRVVKRELTHRRHRASGARRRPSQISARSRVR